MNDYNLFHINMHQRLTFKVLRQSYQSYFFADDLLRGEVSELSWYLSFYDSESNNKFRGMFEARLE